MLCVLPRACGGQSHLTSAAAAQFVARGELLFPHRLLPGLIHMVFLIIASLKIIIKLTFALKIKVISHRFLAEGIAVSAGWLTHSCIVESGLFLDTERPNVSDKNFIGRYLALMNRCTTYIKVHVVGTSRQGQRGGGSG